MRAVVGVDVGSTSARAGVFDAASGAMLASASRPIETWTYGGGDFVEQSGGDIWRSVCAAVRAALIIAGVAGADVGGVGFDATCSLVVVKNDGAPSSVSLVGGDERNVIVWMDHRAAAEAREITATGHGALRTVGGVCSPEHEIPKILWLARNKKAALAEGNRLFDLADYLTWRATGDATRSLCTLVCKWNLRADARGAGWDDSFLEAAGLADLRRTCDVGDAFAAPGAPLGAGLTAGAAADLGLDEGTAVGVGLIDAHAGGVGVLGGGDVDGRLALVAGTSCCHMATASVPVFAPGVWGPYYGAMVPGKFLNEGGQSAAGKLLDFVIASHPARASLGDGDAHGALAARLHEMAGDRPVFELARHVHVDPDFYGNRAPLADASRTGSVVGLTLDGSVDDLAVRYLATLLALCYQTRHILDALVAAGHERFSSVVLTGGLAKNALYVRATADATGLPVSLPREREAVLLGSAMLGAAAAGLYPSLPAAMAAMSGVSATVHPDPATAPFHERKYAAFRRLVDLQTDLRALML